MPAGITSSDGVFTVRNPAWWDLEGAHTLSDYPTREEAKAIAHPWEPMTESLWRIVQVVEHLPAQQVACFAEDGCTPGTHPEHFVTKSKAQRVEDYDLVVRDDDRYPLGVKPKSRALVTNDEMYDIAEALMKGQGTGQVLFETGGSLQGGRKVWLLMRFSEPIQIAGRNGTETIPFYALQNANDGSGAFRGQATEVCIVCQNTSHMADLDAQLRGTEFVFRHTKNVAERIEEAKVALEGWQESVAAFQGLAEHLIHLPVTPQQRTIFVREFIRPPQESLVSDRVLANVEADRKKMEAIFDSPTQEVTKDTVWGLVQASIEYSQWYRRAKSNETRFKRAYLDRSRLTTSALELALEVSKA